MDGAGYQVAELAGGKLEELGQVAWVATLINGLKILKIQVTVANLFLFCLWVDNDQNVQWDPTIGPIGTKLLLFVILWVDCWRSQRPVTIPLSAPYFFLPMLRCQRGESLRTGSWFDVRWILTATRCTGLKGSIAPDFHWFSTIQHQPIPPKFCVLSFLRSRCRSRCFFCALGHSSLWEDWGGLHFDASWIDTAKSEHVLSQLADSLCTVHNYSPPTTSSRNERTHCSHKTKLCSLQDATDV